MPENVIVSETSGPRLRAWLLLALEDLGGSGQRPAVHGRVEQLFGGSFTHEDRAARVVSGVPREPAWRNNLDSLYDRMKKSGHLQTVPRGGPWTLARSGEQELLALTPPGTSARVPVAEADLLRDFKPSDSTDYLSHVRGQVLVKSRSHEDVLMSYGSTIVRHGWAPTTSVHPRDLELHRGDDVCLGEVKVVYKGNATHAVREAVAQLLEYRHFHYPGGVSPVLLAIFSEAIGDAFVDYLGVLGIASVWREGLSWRGSQQATWLALVPEEASFGS